MACLHKCKVNRAFGIPATLRNYFIRSGGFSSQSMERNLMGTKRNEMKNKEERSTSARNCSKATR